MALQGTAFLPIWHDVDAAMEAEFNRWHTVEHIPERVLTPGIVVGSRWQDLDAGLHRYFTLYEASAFEVFESDGYFMTANARTEWTQRVHPAFQNFLRAPCHLALTRGRGTGGVLATLRVRLQPGDAAGGSAVRDAFSVRVRPLVEAFAVESGITGLHLGLKGVVRRQPLSSGSLSLRPGATGFDAVLMLEGISRSLVGAAAKQLEAALRAQADLVSDCETGVYELAYRLAESA